MTDLAELIVEAANRAHRTETILALGGTVLCLEAPGSAGGRRTAYHIVRADVNDDFRAHVWYPYMQRSPSHGPQTAQSAQSARFRMRIDERNLPVVYLVSTTMLSTFTSELNDTKPDAVRVLAHMSADSAVILYDRTAHVAPDRDVATDPEMVRCVREGFTIALHAALGHVSSGSGR